MGKKKYSEFKARKKDQTHMPLLILKPKSTVYNVNAQKKN